MNKSGKHPVWNILNKEKYVEECYSEFEEMYDFLNSLCNQSGNITKDGNTVPVMKVLLDMWDKYGREISHILDSILNKNIER